jgi:hypothetical protein
VPREPWVGNCGHRAVFELVPPAESGSGAAGSESPMHSPIETQGPVPSATSLLVFVLVCALLLFVIWG